MECKHVIIGKGSNEMTHGSCIWNDISGDLCIQKRAGMSEADDSFLLNLDSTIVTS